jgi:hypothetical protein
VNFAGTEFSEVRYPQARPNRHQRWSIRVIRLPRYGSMLRMLLIKGRRESSFTTHLTPPHLQGRRLCL